MVEHGGFIQYGFMWHQVYKSSDGNKYINVQGVKHILPKGTRTYLRPEKCAQRSKRDCRDPCAWQNGKCHTVPQLKWDALSLAQMNLIRKKYKVRSLARIPMVKMLKLIKEHPEFLTTKTRDVKHAAVSPLHEYMKSPRTMARRKKETTPKKHLYSPPEQFMKTTPKKHLYSPPKQFMKKKIEPGESAVVEGDEREPILTKNLPKDDPFTLYAHNLPHTSIKSVKRDHTVQQAAEQNVLKAIGGIKQDTLPISDAIDLALHHPNAAATAVKQGALTADIEHNIKRAIDAAAMADVFFDMSIATDKDIRKSQSNSQKLQAKKAHDAELAVKKAKKDLADFAAGGDVCGFVMLISLTNTASVHLRNEIAHDLHKTHITTAQLNTSEMATHVFNMYDTMFFGGKLAADEARGWFQWSARKGIKQIVPDASDEKCTTDWCQVIHWDAEEYSDLFDQYANALIVHGILSEDPIVASLIAFERRIAELIVNSCMLNQEHAHDKQLPTDTIVRNVFNHLYTEDSAIFTVAISALHADKKKILSVVKHTFAEFAMPEQHDLREGDNIAFPSESSGWELATVQHVGDLAYNVISPAGKVIENLSFNLRYVLLSKKEFELAQQAIIIRVAH